MRHAIVKIIVVLPISDTDLPKDEGAPASGFVLVIRLLAPGIEGLSGPMQFDDQRDFMANQWIRSFVQLGPDPELVLDRVFVGQVQGGQRRSNAVPRGVTHAHVDAFELKN